MSLLQQLTMGCICSRETVTIANRRFYVRQRLGDGGFSVVDLVEDARSHKMFALKRIPCHSEGDEKTARTEVEYMNCVKHVNLVPCEAHSLIPLDSYGPALNMSAMSEMLIVMPYYWKGSLQGELESLSKKRQHMEERRLLHIFSDTCEGLKALHHLSPTPLAHRDLKPHNVMYEHDDTPVLMDFGSMGRANIDINGSRDALRMQDFASERCSMPYRAPELFTIESHCTITAKTDIWSLGCTLYAMCYHESPFDKIYQRGDSIALAAMAGKVDIPSNNPYSNELKELILTMMIVNPIERPDIDRVIQQVDTVRNRADNRV